MLRIEDENRIFNFRVAAVMIHEGKVLLHRYNDQTFYALPGGRAEMMEQTSETIVREMQEELDETVIVNQLLNVNEVFFYLGEKQVHELGFYYHVTLPSESVYLSQEKFVRWEVEGDKLDFEWIAIDKLEEYTFYPENMIEIIRKLPQEVCHMVSDEIGDRHVG